LDRKEDPAMSASGDEIDRAVKLVGATWTATRAARCERELEKRLYTRRSRSARTALIATTVLVAAAAALLLIAGPQRLHSASNADGVGVALSPGEVLLLPDGTTASPLDNKSEVRLVESEPVRRTVRVMSGGARFDVRPQGKRTFRVEMRDVAVEVLGTAFSVDESGDRVRVAVDRGRVRTFFNGAATELGAGDVRFFPPLPDSKAVIDGDGADALLKRADSARAAGDLGASAARLHELLARFPGDERAPLAAFTLGLVLLEGGGTPREAALAFVRARRLDPGGELAEDALAREVEAWALSGARRTAMLRAHEYEHSYPHGRRVVEVRRYATGR
jgi:ferric-dicitrate binding protein FerR (iron transport regulator)